MEEPEEAGCCRVRMIEYHDYKTLMGPCLISFSIPLLIPGVVLTIVGSYGNEHTFPSFGGWHITGIVILTLAVSLLLVGIVFKCFFRPYLSPDVAQHLTPRHSVVSGHLNLGFESERDAQKATKRVYKGSDQPDLNTQINTQLHRVVSTHEVREKGKASSDTVEPNGTIAHVGTEQRNSKQKQSGKQNNKVNHRDSSGENEKPFKPFKQIAEENDENIVDRDNEETPHKEKKRKNHRSKRSSSTTEETNEDGVTTKVTSSVRAEADTQVVTESDREKNPSLQSQEERRRRRRKKKKKQRSEETSDELHPTAYDIDIERNNPDLRTTVNPQTHPNVPYNDSAQYVTEFDLITPRPVEETQHIPAILRHNMNTGANDSISNAYSDYTRFQQRAKEEFGISYSDKETDDAHCYKENEPESEPYHSEIPQTFSIHKRAGIETIDTTITQEPDPQSIEPETSGRHRKRRSRKSKHSEFLKKRGINSDEQDFQVKPSIETNLNLDPPYLDIHTHNVQFQPADETDFQHITLPDTESQTHIDENVNTNHC